MERRMIFSWRSTFVLNEHFLQEIWIATWHIISEDLFTALWNPEIIKPLVKRDFLNTDDFKTLEGIKSPNKAELKEIEFIEYSKHLLDFIYLLSKDKISLQDAHEILSKVNDIIEKLASKEQFNVLLPEIKTIERYLAGVDFDIEVKRQEKYVLLNEWDVSELSEEELWAIYEMTKEYLPFLENLPFYYNYKRYETHLKTSLNWWGSEAIQIAPQDDYYSEQCWIFLMRGWSNKNKQSYKLRVTTDEICTPHLIALSLQIWSYLKNKSFINTQQLHYHIHNMLFKLDIWDIECFDVSIFEKQFEELTRSLVLPLCNPKCNNGEHLNIPALNVLLTWVYGTGKTQSLKYLKQTNGFDINWEKYVLNANRICLTANEFFTLLTHQNESLLEYLIDLYHFTWLPALLFVEDIDTILQKADENDSVWQALTEFLEWSSLFPCKVISTTNYPERINPRHLRPNRFEKIVDFHIPKEKELREKIASQHVEKFFNNLIQDSEKNMIIEYAAEVSSGWTTSHVFWFIKECYSVYRIEQALRWKGIIINKDLLDDILNRYIVPKDDIREREHQHNEWLKGLKWKSDTELAEDDQKYVL